MNSNWYQLSVQDVVRQLETDPARGLTDGEAGRRLEKYGPNELIERGGRTSWQILVEQVTNILTLILIGAAAVSIFLGDILDAIVIMAIVVLNALLGFSQEYRAEQAMAALKRMAVPIVRVRREGTIREISARDLVPGDVVLLETGNVVPADGRVLESVNLRVQESALTGESEAVDKEADLVFDAEKPLGDRRNMVYSGTIVNYGHGQMIVTETGMQTELGHIAEMIQSVDSLRLAEAIHQQSGGARRRVLVQVNLAGEATKAGFAPDDVAEALTQMARWDGLTVEGLMAVPPSAADPEAVRPYFRQLRTLADRLNGIKGISMATLSMGMSHDFEVAIEEGSTMVRIGTALFGKRVG